MKFDLAQWLDVLLAQTSGVHCERDAASKTNFADDENGAEIEQFFAELEADIAEAERRSKDLQN